MTKAEREEGKTKSALLSLQNKAKTEAERTIQIPFFFTYFFLDKPTRNDYRGLENDPKPFSTFFSTNPQQTTLYKDTYEKQTPTYKHLPHTHTHKHITQRNATQHLRGVKWTVLLL